MNPQKVDPTPTLATTSRVLICLAICACTAGLYAGLVAGVDLNLIALSILPLTTVGLLFGLRVGLVLGGAIGAGFLAASSFCVLPASLRLADVVAVVLGVAVTGVVGRLRDLRKRLGTALGKTTAVEGVLWHINSELTAINEQLEADRLAARRIQQSLIPDAGTRIPGLRAGWFFEPSEEVGGDLFSIFRIDEYHAGLYILDVSGHGVPAAFFTIGLNRALSPQIGTGSLVKTGNAAGGYALTSPAEVAVQLNRMFPQDEEQQQFFTFVYGLIDLKTFELTYSVAGHPGPVLSRATEEPTLLSDPSFPVGVEASAEFEERCIRLSAGDRFYLYTDGLNEMPGREGACFGDENLLQIVAEVRGRELPQAVEDIRRRLDSFRGGVAVQDDVALLAIEVASDAGLSGS